ncbi:MAG: ferrous iron transport protein B [bacterium]
MKSCCKQKQDSDQCNKEQLDKIVLVGNPNVGKSVVFNNITGCYVEVSNYPGTTVDISKSCCKNAEIIDAPGIYGIGNFNDEEKVAREVILEADYVINVVSAISLDRDLFLTRQLIDYGFKMIIVLNQIDEAEKKGITIDLETLKSELGVEIYPSVATKKIGMTEVNNCILNRSLFRQGTKDENIFNLTESNSESIEKLEAIEEKRDIVYKTRRGKVNNIVEKTVMIKSAAFSISKTIGNLLLNPFYGFIISAIVLLSLYQIVGVWIAGDLVDFIENKLLIKYYIPFAENLVGKFITIGWLKEILAGEFGLLTMTVQYILGVLLPLVMGFYFFMAILEDSGYLPRLAALTDRVLSKIGLNGRAIIPIILGFGCVTMATITTRILGSERERTIANVILGLTIPCSAQLGIIIALLALIGSLKASLIYMATILIVLFSVALALNKLLPGKSTDLLIDLPPMRLPILKNIINKTLLKTWHFLSESTPLFFLGSFLITVLKITGGLLVIQKALEPLTVKIMNLPPETASIFIMGLIRRDFGAAGLAKMAGINGHAVLTHSQILVSIVALTMFVPCIASVVVFYKERGFKEASAIWFGSWIAAFVIGGILAKILTVVHI